MREIYLDDATDRPEWVLVDLEEGSRFVPLAGARIEAETIVVVHGATAVNRAPDFELSKELTQDQERELYDHYDVAVSEEASESLLPEPEPEPRARARADRPCPSRSQPEPTTVPGPCRHRPGASGCRTPRRPAPDRARAGAGAGRGADRGPPPEGETSEPEDQGPMIPPRSEPVAPTPPPPSTPPPPPPYVEAESSDGPQPAIVIAGAAALAILLLIILRRRD